MKKQVKLVSMFLLCQFNAQSAEQQDWFVNLAAGWTHDDNVNQGLAAEDKAKDEYLSVSAQAGYFYDLSTRSLLTTRVQLESQQHQQISGLSWTSIGAEFEYSWQPSFGFLAPFFQISLNATHLESDTDERSADNIQLQTIATKRLTSQITARVGYQYLDSQAGHQVYNQEQNKVFVNLDYLFDQNTTFYGILGYAKGDVHSVAQVTACDIGGISSDKLIRTSHSMVSAADVNSLNNKTISHHHDSEDSYELAPIATASWHDHAFSEAFCGGWYAYKVDGDTLSLSLGGSYNINSALSLDVTFIAAESEITEEYSYKRQLIKAGVMYQF